MRLALFGGSFDPPHRGHLRIALAAADRLQFDRILLAPTGRQPLKQEGAAPFPDRLAMAALLAAHDPRFQATGLDAPHPDRPNYTADTLLRLPPAASHYFLAGADSFLTLHHWRSPELLLQPRSAGGLLDGWILAARPGFPLSSLAAALPPGHTLGPSTPSLGPVLTQTVKGPHGAIPIHILPDLDDPSSATAIRTALASGQWAPELTPEVARYIREHALYRVLG